MLIVKKDMNINKYPINNTLYEWINKEEIQIEYKDTGKRTEYYLVASAGETTTIYIPKHCLKIQSWLEIQWDVAHELGHFLNWKEGYASDNILENERRAWNRAEEILKECEIPLCVQDNKWVISKNFYEEMGRCLGSYRVAEMNVMIESKASEKIKHAVKEIFLFFTNGITMYFASIGMLGILINVENRELLFTQNTLIPLFRLLFIIYGCYFVTKKIHNYNRTIFHNKKKGK